MVLNNTMCRRISTKAILSIFLGFVVCLQAEEIPLLKPKKPAGAIKVLPFPSGQYIGNLYLEPESGPGWDPEHVSLYGEWEYLNAAQGDVLAPEDRNIKLWVRLTLSSRESAKFRSQNPQAYQLTIADRVRKDPDDLSGLSELNPNDLFWLSVGTEMYLRAGANPRIFEPISHLTDLRILTLFSTGITDEGLEHLRPLRSLRGLELHQTSISNSGLAVLKDLPALEYLQLNTGITDAGLRQVAQLSNLRWLNIMGGKMWGPGLTELAKLPRLERLCFWGARGGGTLTDRHIKYLENLTQLKGLTLQGVDALTDTSLASIAKLTNLEELYFIRCSPRFTVAGAAHLKKLKNLKKISFAQILWSSSAGKYNGDEVVLHLSALPNLESIEGIACLTAEGMKTLARFRNLKYLQAGLNNHILGYDGPTGVSHLAGLASLEELHIYNYDSLSDADIASLELLSRLKKLDVGSRRLTDRNMASFGKLKQLESLGISVLGGPGSSEISKSGLNQLNSLSNLRFLNVGLWENSPKADPADELMLDLSGLKKMKEMHLSGLSLQDSDLAFLEHLPLLENLSIQPEPGSSLNGTLLRYLTEMPELNRLYVSGLSGCTGEDLAHLNGLPKLRSLRLAGDITDTALAYLTGPLSLDSLRVETDEPIRKQTVTDLTNSHPVIEYIHIHELYKAQTRPVRNPKRTRVSPPRTNRRAPATRRRERR